MADEAHGSDETEMMKAVHLVQGINQSISKDGKVSCMVFEIMGKEKLAITVESEKLPWLQEVLANAKNLAEQKGMKPGTVAFKDPKTYAVGTAPEFMGSVTVAFDQGMPTQAVYKFMNRQSALQFAKSIEHYVMSTMTQPEKRDLMMTPMRRPLIIPPGSKQ